MTLVALTDADAIRAWLVDRGRAAAMVVTPSSVAASTEWRVREGVLDHRSERFFRMVGLSWTEDGNVRHQPFIEQREVGTLGFITRRGVDGLELLLHAKAEPGNVGLVQVAPTCQATASNLDRVHGGESPPYAWAFSSEAIFLTDQLQSEHGSRFLGKANRNAAVEAQADVEVGGDHIWASFRALAPLLLDDFLINTDARSVLCAMPWSMLAPADVAFGRGDVISVALRGSFMAPVREGALAAVSTALRLAASALPVVQVPIDRMPGWRFDPESSVTLTNGVMALRHIAVNAASREVKSWDQPILDSGPDQIIDLDAREDSDGVLRFGFRPRWEPGLSAGAELAPTRAAASGAPCVPLLQVRQSDEGGRFWRDVSLYRICPAAAGETDPTLQWLSLSEIEVLMGRSVFNNEARSAISLLLAHPS